MLNLFVILGAPTGNTPGWGVAAVLFVGLGAAALPFYYVYKSRRRP